MQYAYNSKNDVVFLWICVVYNISSNTTLQIIIQVRTIAEHLTFTSRACTAS